MFSFFTWVYMFVCLTNYYKLNVLLYVFKPRSISGKKLCSSCGLPLGKGAAMIIETLNLYFHIQCFRVCIYHSSLRTILWCLLALFCAEKYLLEILTAFAHEATPFYVIQNCVCSPSFRMKLSALTHPSGMLS